MECADAMKACSKCGEAKPESEFYTYCDRKGVRRPMAKCKSCHLRVAEDWNRRNPERKLAAGRAYRARNVRKMKARKYGLSEAELFFMESSQQGLCMICREFVGDDLVIDHCHEEGAVRGLLCQTCNSGLGFFRDDPKLLVRAIRYLHLGPAWPRS